MTTTINGARLFYREKGSGAPILLIHGMGVMLIFEARRSCASRAKST